MAKVPVGEVPGNLTVKSKVQSSEEKSSDDETEENLEEAVVPKVIEESSRPMAWLYEGIILKTEQ